MEDTDIIKKRFRVTYEPHPRLNNFMRSLDFFREGEGLYQEIVICLVWRPGEVVDEARIKTTMDNIKLAFEREGCEVAEVSCI